MLDPLTHFKAVQAFSSQNMHYFFQLENMYNV